MSSQDQLHRRMQVKVLYSFDNSSTVFLSRSKSQHSVKIAQIPISTTQETDEFLTLGAFDLKSCIQQVVRSSPENFKLQTEDYAVYHKDITEQPDEPFVANGVISSLLNSNKPDLIPGRVCQNLSASFLFGDQAGASSMTLEIRLKFHVTSRSDETPLPKDADAEHTGRALQSSVSSSSQLPNRKKRPLASASSDAAIKATRTKSLPIFCHPPNQQISNIINADKLNAAPKYDSKSISERFNSAPFLSAKIIDKPARYRKRSNIPLTPTVQGSGSLQPQRAMRTRSMVTSIHPMISSPINEEALSEATDDTEYNDNNGLTIEEEEEEEDDYEANQGDSSSPFTPQQPPYKPNNSSKSATTSAILRTDHHQFQSLPDLEDLDSKKTHTIPSSKLPPDHEMICINRNCAALDSVTWRYFETNFHPNYLNIARTQPIDMKLFDGMFGPMCNACYLFLRNKGFMRPEAVVKKYLQQQKYKKELKLKEQSSSVPGTVKPHGDSSPFYTAGQGTRFPTPSHVPSAISEVIRNRNSGSTKFPNSVSKNLSHAQNSQTHEDYQDLNDFVRQLNNFGGPLTDIDMPHDIQNHSEISGVTPPMIATKSNTRVINLCPDEEDKENQPPARYTEFEQMMIKSFSSKSSPEQNDSNDWAQFFGEPTPKDGNSAQNMNNGITPIFEDEVFDFSRPRISPTKSKANVMSAVNMPSSPLLISVQSEIGTKLSNDSSPVDKAKRVDTTMSIANGQKSSPQSEVYDDFHRSKVPLTH